MRLFPRTLLWRSVLLIALLLGLAHLAWLEIFRISEREPRARQVAQQIASIVNLTRAALITADPSRRIELLRELSQEEGIQVYVGDPGERIASLPERPFLRLVEREIKRQLGAETRLATSRDGVRGAWVSFRIDADDYWVFMPRSRLERADPLRWVGWGALVLLLSLVGAYLIVSRINRPLRDLTRAADEIGRGRNPPAIDESGPSEIRTLARAFNQMGTDLRRLDDERALLLAGVSHDLRTPLSRIRLGLEMLDGKGDAALKAGLVQDIEDIDAAINQFLDFARVTEGEAIVAEGDLNAIARELRDRYTRAGKDVAAMLAPLPALPLRPIAVQRLIANLVENALRHGAGPVEIMTTAEDGKAVVEVRDRGPGIPAADAERMLQPFTRLNAARTGTGTGLGLAIVDRIARMHGGSVQLLARDGGGLRVRVEFSFGPTRNAAPVPVRRHEGSASRPADGTETRTSGEAVPGCLLESGFTRLKRCKRGLFMFNRHDLFVGRSLDLYGEWCDSEVSLLLRFLKPGDTVLDIGANIGTHTVPFAEAVGAAGLVLAFEPQRLLLQMLDGNVALNCLTNTHCLRLAVGAAPGNIRIPVLSPTTPNNFAALPAQGHSSGEGIDVATVDSLALDACHLIKIDVEGMEPDVLAGARETITAHKPVLFVENNTVERAAPTLAAILDAGYRAWWHVAPYYNARNFFGNTENVFAEYQPEANLLCLPQGMDVALPGLIECSGKNDDWRKARERAAARAG
jgi:two-component system osmolarity sensor histidine kinase EnvZ